MTEEQKHILSALETMLHHLTIRLIRHEDGSCTLGSGEMEWLDQVSAKIRESKTHRNNGWIIIDQLYLIVDRWR